MIRSPISEAGFSLIETLVALFLIAMLTAGGGALLMQTLQAGKQTNTRTDLLTELQISHALMRDDFGSLALRETRGASTFDSMQGFIGRPAISGEPVMVFARGGWSKPGSTPQERSDLQRIEYRIENQRLIRTAWLRPDPSGETPAIERVMASGFESMRFRYARNGKWFEQWEHGASETGAFAPDLVEVIIRYADGDELRQVFLTGARS